MERRSDLGDTFESPPRPVEGAAECSARTGEHKARSKAEIRPLNAADLPAIAAIQQAAFPGYTLTRLGPRFVRLFYGQFVDKPQHFGFVAVDADRIVGFVVGTTNKDGLYHSFYRRHFVRVALSVLGRAVADAELRRSIAIRRTHIRRAVRAIFRRASRTPLPTQVHDDSAVPARLLSIGVLPEYRGMGIASALVQSFIERMRAEGVDRVGLSAKTSNSGAISFYERTGWIREKETSYGIHYYRST